MKKKYMADIDEEFFVGPMIVCNTRQLLDRLQTFSNQGKKYIEGFFDSN